MYSHIVKFIADTTWALTEDKLRVIQDFVNLKSSGGIVSAEDIAAFKRPPAAPTFLAMEDIEAAQGTTAAPRKGATVALLPLYGMLSPKMNLMTEISGGTSLDMFGSWFRAAVADPNVRAIVIDVDSPGGAVKGVQELADQIFAARGTKPITAMISGTGASAAYWIASAAEKVYITPSGDVGSIGVLVVLEDDSKAMEQAGVKLNVVKAGKFKGEGADGSWTSEAMDAIQNRVDEMFTTFVKAVARGRGVSVSTVRDGFGQGRVLSASMGLEQGMVDKIQTMDITLSKALGRSGLGTIAEDKTPEPKAEDPKPPVPEKNNAVEVLRLRERVMNLL